MSEKYFSHYGEKTIMADVDVNGNSLELTISDNTVTAIGGKTVGGGVGSELPTITEDDNGKVLTVLDGNLAWTPGGEGEIPSAAAANNGDVLTADGQGSYGWSAPTGGGGDDAVYVVLGDLATGIPVGQTEKWDEIAEYLVDGKSVIGRITQGSVSLDASAVIQMDLAYLMSQLGVSTLAELKAACEASDMLDMLTIKFVYVVDGSTLRIDVTPDAGVYPRYVFSDDFIEIQAIGLNMDVSLRPTNVLRFKITNNKYVLDTGRYSYLDDDIEELLSDIVSTCSTCNYTGWMGNTPGESTPAKFYGEDIPGRITVDKHAGITTIRIEVNEIVLKYDPNVPTYALDTLVPAIWRGDFEFKPLHDHNRYWQTKDTAFELATVNE